MIPNITLSRRAPPTGTSPPPSPASGASQRPERPVVTAHLFALLVHEPVVLLQHLLPPQLEEVVWVRVELHPVLAVLPVTWKTRRVCDTPVTHEPDDTGRTHDTLRA